MYGHKIYISWNSLKKTSFCQMFAERASFLKISKLNYGHKPYLSWKSLKKLAFVSFLLKGLAFFPGDCNVAGVHYMQEAMGSI